VLRRDAIEVSRSNMGPRVVLHIGSMKSGTTFLQSAIGQNQETLAEAGVRFLGGSFGKQVKAVRQVLQAPDPETEGRKRSRWLSLVEEAASGDWQTSIVSMEFLSFANDEAVGRFLEPLAGLDVRVVVTVRDQLRAIPAQWQTYTRNQGFDDWATYLKNIQPRKTGFRRSRALRTFSRAQDLAPVLERWGARPEVTELVVVTVPSPGAPKDELWSRFCTASAIPPESADLSSVRDNPSLGYASCDYLRRVNRHLSEVPRRQYRRGIWLLARDALRPLHDDEGRPPLDQRAAAFACERNGEIREAVTARADRLVGTLEDLPLTAAGDRPRRVDPPPSDQVMRAAETAWDHLALQVGEAPGGRPDDLDPLVADSARLIRLANGWD
jgi:hypothetical protein